MVCGGRVLNKLSYSVLIGWNWGGVVDDVGECDGLM